MENVGWTCGHHYWCCSGQAEIGSQLQVLSSAKCKRKGGVHGSKTLHDATLEDLMHYFIASFKLNVQHQLSSVVG
jgi:hypothetical protein